MSRRVFVSLAFIAFGLLACNTGAPKPGDEVMIPFPPQAEAEFTERFGAPDHVALTHGGIPARALIYWREDVRVLYLPSGGQMVFAKYQDAYGNGEIDERQVVVRMSGRDKLANSLHNEAVAKADPPAVTKEVAPAKQEDQSPVTLDVAPIIPRPKFVPGTFSPSPRPLPPARSFTAKLSDSYAAGIDKIKVELKEADLTSAAPSRLVITLCIHNGGLVPLSYEPWSATKSKTVTPSAKNEFGQFFKVMPRTDYSAPAKVEPDQFITDTVAFDGPPSDSQEIDISLPHRNVSLVSSKSFTFKIGRAFFAAKEDARLDAAYLAKQRIAFDRGEAQRLREFEQAEKEASDKKKEDDEVVAAKRKIDEDESVIVAKLKSDPNFTGYVRTPSGKSVYVSGYVDKNGRHVAPHMRAAPGMGKRR